MRTDSRDDEPENSDCMIFDAAGDTLTQSQSGPICQKYSSTLQKSKIRFTVFFAYFSGLLVPVFMEPRKLEIPPKGGISSRGASNQTLHKA